jgi:hypothetical protein
MKAFKIPSYGKSGWFKENYRHYLAAKGISTNPYFARRGQLRPFEYLGRPITDLEMASWIAIAKHKEGLDVIDARSAHPEWSDEEYVAYKDDILTRRAALKDRLMSDNEYRAEIERMAGTAKLRGQYKEEEEGVVKFKDVLEPVGLLGGGLGVGSEEDVKQYLRSKGVFLEGAALDEATAAYVQYAQAKEEYDALNREGTESFGQLAALEEQVEAAKEQLRSLGRADLAGDEFVVAQRELAQLRELKTLRAADPKKLLKERYEDVSEMKERMLKKARSDESLMDFARQRIKEISSKTEGEAEALPEYGASIFSSPLIPPEPTPPKTYDVPASLDEEDVRVWLEQHPAELAFIGARRDRRIAALEVAKLPEFAKRFSKEKVRQERKVVLKGVPEAVGSALARLNREQQRELLEKVDAYQLQLQAINAFERGAGGLMEDRRAELEANAYADTIGTLGFQLPPAVFQEVAGGAFGRKGKGARSGILPAEYVGAEGEKVVGPMFPFSELVGGKRTGRVQRELSPVPVRKYTPSAEAFAAQQAVKSERMAAQVRALQEGAARARLAKKIEAGEEIELTEEEQARLNPK